MQIKGVRPSGSTAKDVKAWDILEFYGASITPDPDEPNVGIIKIGGGYNVVPSGDITGATDTAAINAIQNAGATVYLGSGTFWTTGLIKQSGSWWIGQGPGNTILKLSAGANADVIKGAGFDSLTGTASQGGLTSVGITMMTIDGNASAQTIPLPTVIGSSLGNPFNLPVTSATVFTMTLSDSSGLPPTGMLTLVTLSGVGTVVWTANNIGTNTLTCYCIFGNGGRVNSLALAIIYTNGYGLRWYAYDADLHQLEFRNCVADGLWSEWGTGELFVGNEMDSRISTCKAHNNGRNGVTWAGAHDSNMWNCLWFRNTWANCMFVGYATVNCSYVHVWGAPARFGFDVHSGCTFTGCTVEVTGATNSRGYRIFSGNAAFEGGTTITGGVVYASGTSGGQIGIELGNNSWLCNIDTQVNKCVNGALQIDAGGDGGLNNIRLQVNQLSGPAIVGATPGVFSLAGLASSSRLVLYNTGTPTPSINTDIWALKSTATVLPSATINTYGTAHTDVPTHQAPNLRLGQIILTSSGTFGAETITTQITATYTDGTTASFTTTFTSSGTVYTLTSADKFSLLKNGNSIVSLSTNCKSSIASSTASVDLQYSSD